MTNRSSQQAVIERYRREPQAGARALFIEAVARSLNERQTLIAGSSAAELVTQADLPDVRKRFDAMREDYQHAIYEVRRLTRRASLRRGGRGITARSVRAVARGTRQQMHDALTHLPGDSKVGADDIVRHVLRERSVELPALEHTSTSCARQSSRTSSVPVLTNGGMRRRQMMLCSEHAHPNRLGVAYGQRRWKGLAVKDTPLGDGSLILRALGAAIREHRLQAGLTQAELADRAGIGRPHLNHIEGGRKNPTVVVLVHLAESLGLAPGDLLVSLTKAAS